LFINWRKMVFVMLFLLAVPFYSVYAGGITSDPATSELKVLAIGNSFSDDAMQHVYQIAADLGVKKIVLGKLSNGGCTLARHYSFVKGDQAEYVYSKNTTGVWQSQQNKTMLYGLQDEDWDIITIQQVSSLSGVLSSYQEEDILPFLIRYINEHKTNPDAKLVWHMTWAYQQDSTHASFPTYNRNQMEMYNAIVHAVQEAIVPNTSFALIIPAGTAIQNLRTSYIGDTLTRDGHHLSYNLGRYVAGVTWLHAITGWSIDDLDWVPNATEVPSHYLPLIKEAVKAAVENPFAVTPSSYPTRWFAGPLPGVVETAAIPVQIKTPSFTVRHVKIELDRELLYEGATLPTDLVVRTAALTPGTHQFAVVLTDTTGQTYSEILDVRIEHYSLVVPEVARGNRVKGTITLDFTSVIEPDEYQTVAVELVPLVNGERVEARSFYAGSVLPQALQVDTLAFADGAYDIDVITTTQLGAHYHTQTRIVFKNFDKIEDMINPPVSSWFGTTDRLLAVDRSAGWQFTTASPDLFFNDNSRIRPSSQTGEYLTWEMADLRRFEFTFYVQSVDVSSFVTLFVSADGAAWTQIPYVVQEQGQTNEWVKVLISGEVPADLGSIKQVRLSVDMAKAPSNAIEIGNVALYAPVQE
jgi:hypothetical protein